MLSSKVNNKIYVKKFRYFNNPYSSTLSSFPIPAPSLRISGGLTVRSTTVEEIPLLHGPESRIISGLSPNSFCASWADIGDGLPDILALVVVMGNSLEISLQIILSGRRTPILSVPAVICEGTFPFLFKMSVYGPGRIFRIILFV
jgi:hypothetical protein